MFQRFSLALICLVATTSIFAQKNTLKGKVEDQESKFPIKNAVVMLLSEKDSVILAFTRSGDDGSYSIEFNGTGNVILMIDHPLFAGYVENIKINSSQLSVGTTPLMGKNRILEEIIVRSGGSIRIKGDTTIYTADSFNVSANANVEELLKKLPGIQVDKNGDIKAMGEKVEKVLVDGEEFFGDDPGMAVKNLRADAVKEVQVFDKKSEQSSFTGIDDGNTQKTINLKLKEDRKTGYFGKIGVSGGLGANIPNRFNNNFMFGSFKGKRKIAGYVLNGNTGQDGLSWQENQKYGSSEDNNFEMMDEDGIFSFNFSQNSDEEIYINPENGFMRNLNAGVQYTNKWNNNQTFNLNPKFNEQGYNNQRTTFTRTQLGDSVLNENNLRSTRLNRYNFKNNLIYDWKIDSSNSLKLTVRYNYFHSESEETDSSITTGKTGNDKNSSSRVNTLSSDKNVLFGNLIFKHKFKKARRTLSFNTDFNASNSTSENYLNSVNKTFGFSVPIVFNIDQFTQSSRTNGKFSGKISYTEPLNKYWSMELAYELSLNTGTNNQSTFIKSAGGIKYDEVVDSLTNDFKQVISVHTPSFNFSYNKKKYKFNFGSGFGITRFDLLDRTINKDNIRHFTNFFPKATFVYQYKSNHSLRIKYNGYNTQPTINQLQPLRNNTNLFSQYIGNPDLKPTFSNNINITHNGYNFLKEQWNFQSLNIVYSSNSITYDKTIDPLTGATLSKPINTDGNMNISFWCGTGFKTKKYKLNIQIQPNLNYNRFADVINSRTSFSQTYTSGLMLSANKSVSNKYDLSLSNNFMYNYNKNAQFASNNTFLTNNVSANATIYYKKVWSLIADYNFFSRPSTENLNSIDNHIFNLQLQRTFKNNEYTVYVKARDLFNQNLGIDRSYYGNTFTEENNIRLKRFYMIGFSWDFKNKNNTAKK